MLKFLINISISKILELYMTAYRDSFLSLNDEERDVPLYKMELSDLMSIESTFNRDVVLPVFYENLMEYFKNSVREEYDESTSEGIISIVNTEEWHAQDDTRLILPVGKISEDNDTATLVVLYNIKG